MEQLFLVLEIAVERALADLGLDGDVVHADFMEALTAEELGGGGEDLVGLAVVFVRTNVSRLRGGKRRPPSFSRRTGRCDYKASPG